MEQHNNNLTIGNITRETVEQYLMNYPFTTSTAMNPIFKRFESDVYTLAEEVRKGIVYIYDINELITQIEDIYAGEPHLQDKLDELYEALEDGQTVIIERYGEYDYL